MRTAAFVVASASIVRALVALTLAALLALVGRSFRSPPRRQPDARELEATLSPPREAAVLLLIPAGALLMAGLVAASPLQLVWSRLGGLYIASVPHVLLVIWVSWEAGRRRSVLLAIVAGLAAWASLYYYYAARVAIPLGLIALLAGARAA